MPPRMRRGPSACIIAVLPSAASERANGAARRTLFMFPFSCCDSSADVCRRAHQLSEELEPGHKRRSHTAPGKVQRKEWTQVRTRLTRLGTFESMCCEIQSWYFHVFKQESVIIRAEDGPNLKICPEKRYCDDFETYESVDMEVQRTHQASELFFFFSFFNI